MSNQECVTGAGLTTPPSILKKEKNYVRKFSRGDRVCRFVNNRVCGIEAHRKDHMVMVVGTVAYMDFGYLYFRYSSCARRFGMA